MNDKHTPDTISEEDVYSVYLELLRIKALLEVMLEEVFTSYELPNEDCKILMLAHAAVNNTPIADTTMTVVNIALKTLEAAGVHH